MLDKLTLLLNIENQWSVLTSKKFCRTTFQCNIEDLKAFYTSKTCHIKSAALIRWSTGCCCNLTKHTRDRSNTCNEIEMRKTKLCAVTRDKHVHTSTSIPLQNVCVRCDGAIWVTVDVCLTAAVAAATADSDNILFPFLSSLAFLTLMLFMLWFRLEIKNMIVTQ